MNIKLTSILILFLNTSLSANEVVEYTIARTNITINTAIPPGDENYFDSLFGAFINKVHEDLSIPKDLEILILIGNYYVEIWPKKFISISYDVLRPPDEKSIGRIHGIFWKKSKDLKRILQPSHTGIHLPTIIDINYTDETSIYKSGLKIFYDRGNEEFRYDELFSVIHFGVNNLNLIKRKQSKIEIKVENNFYVSLLTYDTTLINAIPVKRFDFYHDHENLEKINIFYIVLIVLFLFMLSCTTLLLKNKRLL